MPCKPSSNAKTFVRKSRWLTPRNWLNRTHRIWLGRVWMRLNCNAISFARGNSSKLTTFSTSFRWRQSDQIKFRSWLASVYGVDWLCSLLWAFLFNLFWLQIYYSVSYFVWVWGFGVLGCGWVRVRLSHWFWKVRQRETIVQAFGTS